MLTTALLIILILGLGTHLSDGVRVRQEEAILHKLAVPEAHAYYEVLKKRARRVRLLRAITLASLAITLIAARRRFFPPPPRPSALADRAPATAPTHTQAARALADAALARHAAAAGQDPAAFQAPSVSGDDRHPWIFEYRPRSTTPRAPAVIRVYVDRQGRTEVHQIVAAP